MTTIIVSIFRCLVSGAVPGILGRFVGCVGPAGPSNGVMGPFQVLVDREVVWIGKRFTRLSRARYIDIPLPIKGGKRITLRVANETKNKAVWANAGFKLKRN